MRKFWIFSAKIPDVKLLALGIPLNNLGPNTRRRRDKGHFMAWNEMLQKYTAKMTERAFHKMNVDAILEGDSR